MRVIVGIFAVLICSLTFASAADEVPVFLDVSLVPLCESHGVNEPLVFILEFKNVSGQSLRLDAIRPAGIGLIPSDEKYKNVLAPLPRIPITQPGYYPTNSKTLLPNEIGREIVVLDRYFKFDAPGKCSIKYKVLIPLTEELPRLPGKPQAAESKEHPGEIPPIPGKPRAVGSKEQLLQIDIRPTAAGSFSLSIKDVIKKYREMPLDQSPNLYNKVEVGQQGRYDLSGLGKLQLGEILLWADSPEADAVLAESMAQVPELAGDIIRKLRAKVASDEGLRTKLLKSVENCQPSVLNTLLAVFREEKVELPVWWVTESLLNKRMGVAYTLINYLNVHGNKKDIILLESAMKTYDQEMGEHAKNAIFAINARGR